MSTPLEINPRTNEPYSINARVLRTRARGLPVFQKLDDILDTVKQHAVTILVGEPEDGTIQISQAFLSSLPAGKAIAVTQTRSSAAEKVTFRYSPLQCPSVRHTNNCTP
jgi:HrpA-like RNA helicase